MALKDKWVDKVDGVDIASAEDINQVASAVIELENQVESGGGKGEDGFSPVVSVEKIEGGNRVVITDAKGDNTFDVMDGADGKDGQDGVDGKDGTSVTVESVNESTEDGGSNVVTFSDGQTLRVKNGSKGSKGDKGDKGDPYTLTEADKAVIVRTVIETLGGDPVFGYVDEDSKTIVFKNAPDGKYTLAYIDDEGNIVGPIGAMDKDTNVYYSVSNNLTNCTNSNSATQVKEGDSYSATITANDGYELKTVTVTMGGANVSVGVGKINIASVTGNIVITAVAEEATVEINNLAQPDATATGEAAWNSGGWCNNSYMAGSSYAYRSATDGRLTTNTIAVEYGDTIYVKGIDYASANYPQVAVFDASGTKLLHGYAQYVYNNGYINELSASTGSDYWSFTLTSASGDRGVRFVRFAGYPSGDISDIIITRNQPIE